jgi:hypothetical protein
MLSTLEIFAVKFEYIIILQNITLGNVKNDAIIENRFLEELCFF